MSEPFLGEIKIMAFDYAPKGWAVCNGQVLAINQNQALFALLGTTYGGNGQTTFALPDLRGRVPFHVGSGFALGQRGGEEAHALTLPEAPAHTHRAMASSLAASTGDPTGAYWAEAAAAAYGSDPNVTLAEGAVSATGGGQAHENRSPYLVLSFCIALVGIFPSRS